MAESMRGLKRTYRCGEVTEAHIGETVTLMGWVQKRRNLGSLIFVDLRDRSGLMQIVFDENDVGSGLRESRNGQKRVCAGCGGPGREKRGAVNEKISTGALELRATQIRILSEAQTPPFPIEENSQTKEELRLKYRYLDLRRPIFRRISW